MIQQDFDVLLDNGVSARVRAKNKPEAAFKTLSLNRKMYGEPVPEVVEVRAVSTRVRRLPVQHVAPAPT